MKLFYVVMCILGTALPFGALVPWLVDNGFNLSLLFSDATHTKIATFAWLDVLVSAIVLLFFIWSEGTRQRIRNLWVPTLATFLIGVSLGLPLFLLMREQHLEKRRQLS